MLPLNKSVVKLADKKRSKMYGSGSEGKGRNIPGEMEQNDAVFAFPVGIVAVSYNAV